MPRPPAARDVGPGGAGFRRLALDAALDALAVLLPIECAGCGSPDRSVCAECRRLLEPAARSTVLACGLRVESGLDYDGVARSLILAVKEEGRTDAAAPLGAALHAAVRASLRGAGAIEPALVPGSRAAYRRRGYDPVRVIAKRAGIAVPRPVLVRVARPASQKTLSEAARAVNSAGSMSARTDVAGRRFLVIDDVVTTGSTLTEAARALRAAGAEVVGAATAAATPRRLPRHPDHSL